MKDRFAKAEALFHEALELPPEGREAFVQKNCGADAGLRQEVVALLRASGVADHWLKDTDCAVVGSSVGKSLPDSNSEGPGAVIDRYKLLEKIGEGGFGVVYMAEQEQPVRRKVALKIIKLGMDTRSVIARFESERQALALMDHPNIAKVLDAGATDTGRPYFVMELVRGVPITKFCEERQLNTAERLALFIQVCGAIQHAHQKGIIHRDIKPTNVLVTLNDGVPYPMVIDFGVAKALNERLTEKTLFTNFAQMIGTPAYMSPEQAEMSKLDVDTRSDVYSLGVLLYELLTGTTPFPEERLRSAGYAEIQRIITEEEPERPSTRLTALQGRKGERGKGSGGAGDVATLNSQLKSLSTDLDWVVMKCLEKDRARRYGTANGLAADLRRFLNSEPIVARPPSNLYRLRKLIRRNKLAFAAGAAVISALIIGLGLSTWLFLRERAALKKADENAARAEQKSQESRRNLYAADMIRAQDALEDGNIGRAKELLRKHLPTSGEKDLRGWEWRYAWNQCRSDELFTLAEHTLLTVVTSLALSSNGATLASGDQGGRVMLWDLEQKKSFRSLNTRDMVQGLAFSGDEKELIVGTTDGRVTFWNCETWQPVTILTNLTYVRSLTVSPDRKLLAVFGLSVLTLWSLADRQQLDRFPLLGEREVTPGGVAFSPDSSLLAYCRGDGGIVLWDIANSNRVAEFEGHARYVTALAFSLDGSTLVSGSRDRTVRIWDVASRKERRILLGFSSVVVGLAFSPEGTFLAVVGADQRVRLFETQSWEEINVLKGHSKDVWAVVFAPDGKTMMTGSRDGTIKGWAVSTNQQPISQRLPSDIYFAGLLNGAKALYVAHTNKPTYGYWSTDPLQEIARFQIPHPHFASTMSPDGKLWFGRTSNDVVKVFDSQQRFLTDLPLPATLPSQARFAFSQDSRMLAGRGDDHICRVWKLATSGDAKPIASQVAEFPVRRQPVWSLKLSDTGRLLAIGYGHGIVEIWDIASGEKFTTLVGERWTVMDIAISRDESMAVTASGSGKASVWDLSSAREIATFSSEIGSLLSVTFSPDGSRIAACGGEGTVRIWELETKQEVAALKLHNHRLDQLAFRDDGSLIVLANDAFGDSRLFILRAPEIQEAATAKRDEDSGSTQPAPLATPTFPQRSAKTPANLLDLSAFYNYTYALHETAPPLFQQRPQRLGDVEFDVRGAIRLDCTNQAYSHLSFPSRVNGLKVLQKCRELHFLHAAAGPEIEGVHVATYAIRYNDGQVAEVPIKYGEDLRTIGRVDQKTALQNRRAAIVWRGTTVVDGDYRLFSLTWSNPRPDVEIRTIDFISKMTASSPILVAITAEP